MPTPSHPSHQAAPARCRRAAGVTLAAHLFLLVLLAVAPLAALLAYNL
jgi:hypothetical protein